MVPRDCSSYSRDMPNLATGLGVIGYSILLVTAVMAFFTARFYRRGRFGVEVMAPVVDVIDVYDEAGTAHALKVEFTVPGRGLVVAESSAYLRDSLDRGDWRGRCVQVRYAARRPTKVYIEGWDTPLRAIRRTLWGQAISAAAGAGLLIAALVLKVAS